MKIKNILICGLVLLGMIGCDDFESVNTNPDSTNKVTSAMLATELLRDITTYKNGNGKDFIRDELLAKYLSWTEANDIDLAFNLLGGANYDALRDLRNASKMIDFATNDELKNSYTALSHFVRVFFFFNLTMQVGDIPNFPTRRHLHQKMEFFRVDKSTKYAIITARSAPSTRAPPWRKKIPPRRNAYMPPCGQSGCTADRGSARTGQRTYV